jgi:hypothetical protein
MLHGKCKYDMPDHNQSSQAHISQPTGATSVPRGRTLRPTDKQPDLLELRQSQSAVAGQALARQAMQWL